MKPYIRKVWLDHITEQPNRRRLTEVEPNVYDISKEQGEVLQDGTPLNAANLNNIEKGIADLSEAVINNEGYPGVNLLADYASIHTNEQTLLGIVELKAGRPYTLAAYSSITANAQTAGIGYQMKIITTDLTLFTMNLCSETKPEMRIARYTPAVTRTVKIVIEPTAPANYQEGAFLNFAVLQEGDNYRGYVGNSHVDFMQNLKTQNLEDRIIQAEQNIDLLKPSGGTSAGNTVTAYIDSILNHIPNNTISFRSVLFGNNVRRMLVIDRRTNQAIVLAISNHSIEHHYRTLSGEWTSRTANLS